MSNWIDDGHGNKWHRCKLGADCGLKVIEAGRARCWCQDQEASRCEVQAAREEIAKLEEHNDRLREEMKKEKIDRSLDGWNEAAIINELKRENAALRKTIDDLREQLRNRNAENAALQEDKAQLDSGTIMLTVYGERVHHVAVDLRAAIDTARKEAQP